MLRETFPLLKIWQYIREEDALDALIAGSNGFSHRHGNHRAEPQM